MAIIYEGAEWPGTQPKSSLPRSIANFIWIVAGSSIFSIVLDLVLAGIGQSGVYAVLLTHGLFIAAAVVAVFGSLLASVVAKLPWGQTLLAVVLTLLIVGIPILCMDGWLMSEKANQDALTQPVPVARFGAPAPPVPIVKTPKASATVPAKPEQDNSVHIGTGAQINQNSHGNCSPNVIGGSPTINCQTPQMQIDAAGIAQLKAITLPTGVSLFVMMSDDPGAKNVGFQLVDDVFNLSKTDNWAVVPTLRAHGITIEVQSRQDPGAETALELGKILSQVDSQIVVGAGPDASRKGQIVIVVGGPRQ